MDQNQSTQTGGGFYKKNTDNGCKYNIFYFNGAHRYHSSSK